MNEVSSSFSIDQANRDPSGEAAPGPGRTGQGSGYVGMVNALLIATHLQEHIRVINPGVSGNTIFDLRERWEQDVLDLQPDWLSVMIGINDVWRHFDHPFNSERHHTVEAFETTYRELLSQTRSSLKGLVLMSPYVIERDAQDAMRVMMDQYSTATKRLAGEFDACFVETQAAFDRLVRHYHPTSLAWDRIHPNASGHMAIARAFLDAIEFQWELSE